MPILHSNLETDLRLAVALDQSLAVTLTDQAAIRNLPGAINFLGTVNGTGSDTSRIRYASLGGSDHFSATAGENTDESETALTDTSVDIAVVRAALVRNVGDLAVATGFAQDINPAVLAADMAASLEGYFNGLIAADIATAGTDKGQSGVDLSVDDFYDAIFFLEQGSVPSPYFAMLAPIQFTDFQSSLRSEGGAVQFSPATQAMLQIAGQGLAGSFMGVNIFKSSDVTTATGNRHGAMWGAGALGYKIAIANPGNFGGSSVVVRMDELVIEISRDASTALTEVVGNAYLGTKLLEDARIVGLVTDA